MTTLLPFLLALLLATGCGTVPNGERRVASQVPPMPIPVSSVQFQVSSAAPQVSATAAPMGTAPASPQLHITCEPPAMIQDSTNLTVWEDLAILSGLDVIASGNRFFRASAAPTIPLTWDASPGATGYKVYWGKQSGIYHNSLPMGSDTFIALTVSNPGPTVYIAVTATDGETESDFSNEVQILTVKPVLTITRK